jgi:phage gp45-like
MAEITDDLKIDLLEISQSNGINLTSESTRIKHTKNGQFDITSNGPINISGGDGSNFDGLSVVINGANGLENSNSSGGSIVIAGGH